jgi:3-phytase
MSRSVLRVFSALLAASLLLAPIGAYAASDNVLAAQPRDPVRFATYNASLNRNLAGQLVSDLSSPNNAQAKTVAEIIQRTRPDVLLINEFDFVEDGVAAELFQDNYLSNSQNGAAPISYPYYFVAPSNTGIPSGFDLNNNGSIGGPDDAYGFGFFPGQFGMAVYSMHPINSDDIRTFNFSFGKTCPVQCCPMILILQIPPTGTHRQN